MSSGSGLGLVAGLCAALSAGSTRFGEIHTSPRFKVYSPRETLLQDVDVVARWSGLWNRQFTMNQRMVSNPPSCMKTCDVVQNRNRVKDIELSVEKKWTAQSGSLSMVGLKAFRPLTNQ